MGKDYFLKYETDRTEEPYTISEEMRKQLVSVKGLEITYEGKYHPVLIVKIPLEKLQEVRSLEGITLMESTQFQPFK